MDNEDQTVAEMIRNGSYFREARAWYQTVYINIIPDRAFFLLITLLATLTGMCGVIAFTDITPIVPRQPALIPSRDIYADVPSLTRLRADKEHIDVALQRFFIISYINNRESYDAEHASAAKAFISAHADPSVLPEYLSSIDAANPQSLPNVLGANGARNVRLQSYSLNSAVEPPVATVLFTTTDTINDTTTTTNWRATLAFYYTPIIVKEVVDKQSGETIIQTEDPQFQVVKYDREKLQ